MPQKSKNKSATSVPYSLPLILQTAHKSKILPIVLLSLIISAYILFFSVLTVDRHNRFDSNAYDLGIIDQQIWHHSRFAHPFNTIRGMHIFGDHFTPLGILISPLYWFFDDVRALLIFQTIILAIAIIPLFLIAKHYFKSNWIPLVFCIAYLLYPGLHWGNLEDFHFEAFMPLFILCMFYFILKKKKAPYLIFFFLALLAKEDVAASTFLIGVYVYFKHDKKIGVFTSAVSLIWFLLVVYAIIPFFAGESYVSMGRIFGNFGGGPSDVFLSIFKPSVLFDALFNDLNAQYVWAVFSPVAFLAILNPATLIISASLWINLITAWPYAHSTHYHYILAVIPFIFMSVVVGLAKFRKNKLTICMFLVLLIGSSVVANYTSAPDASSIKKHKDVIEKFAALGNYTEEQIAIYQMIRLIPENASVSAFHFLVPHLAHRSNIYMFPNPFESHYWGTPNKEYPAPSLVDYLLIKKGSFASHNASLQPFISNYSIIRESQQFELWQAHKQ